MTSRTLKSGQQRLPIRSIDFGIALIACIGLLLGWLLMNQTQQRVIAFSEEANGLSLSYPATWNSVDSLQDLVLKIEDPLTAAAFKTVFSVERRDLDPASPPTLQTLLDRRIEDRSQLMGYHLLSDTEASVAGARAIQLDYAYVVQPIDEPRRVSLPIVVQSREYIIVASDRSYYLTFAAPSSEFSQASARLEQILNTVELP